MNVLHLASVALLTLSLEAPSLRACPIVLELGTLSYPQTPAATAARDLSRYMLRGVIDVGQERAFVDNGETWEIDCSALAQAVTPEMLAGRPGNRGALDYPRIRDIYATKYHHTIAARGQERWAPSTLAELRGETSYSRWPQRIVELSNVKRKSRRIFRSPEGFLPVISVSETLDSTSGDPAAPVLETEVAIKRRGSEDWDFYSYDHNGERVPWGVFPAGQRPVPQVCMGCHYDSMTGAVERFFP